MMQYEQLRWWLLPACVVHNFEEWLMWSRCWPACFEVIGGVVPAAQFLIGEQSWGNVAKGLLLATIASVGVIVFGAAGHRSRFKDWCIFWLVSVYLANVFFPHVILSIDSVSYTPGVVTAVTLVLPLGVAICQAGWRECRLSVGMMVGAMAAGVLSLPLVIQVVFLLVGFVL